MSSHSALTARLPHPGIPALVALHLRSLVREFPVAWILFGSMAIGVPLLVLTEMGTDPVRLAGPLGSLQGITFLVAAFWPDAVWRSLPPGGRRVMDALPVDRRTHRLARVAAGFTLPLLMAVSTSVSQAVLLTRHGASGAAFSRTLGELGVLFLGLLAIYLLGSAVALRLSRVILAMLLIGVMYVLVPILFMEGIGQNAAANWYIQFMVQGSWSPVQAMLSGFKPITGALQVVAWVLALGGLCYYLAGRHDTR
ncbi:hypothetical protein BH23GEM11_BH23GEM11_16450 [soil metagenome]